MKPSHKEQHKNKQLKTSKLKKERYKTMNKKLLVLLTTGTLLATSVAAAGCSAKKPVESEMQQITVQTESAPSEIETKTVTTEVTEAGENPVIKLVGRYICERAVMQIEADGNDGAKISITFGGSYDSEARFTMSGKYDANTKTIVYEDGVKTEVTLDKDQKVVSEKEVYTNGKGEFLFTDEGVIWNDKMENIAENMIFKLDTGLGSLTDEELADKTTKPAKPAKKTTTKKTTKAKTTAKPTTKPANKPTVVPQSAVCEPLETAPSDVGEPAVAPSDVGEPAVAPTAVCKPVKAKPNFKYGKTVYTYKDYTAYVTIKEDNSISIVLFDNTKFDGKYGTQLYWEMTGTVNPKTNVFKFSDGVKHYIVINERGTMANRVEYLKGTGEFKFGKNSLSWKDNMENAGNGLAFKLSK